MEIDIYKLNAIMEHYFPAKNKSDADSKSRNLSLLVDELDRAGIQDIEVLDWVIAEHLPAAKMQENTRMQEFTNHLQQHPRLVHDGKLTVGGYVIDADRYDAGVFFTFSGFLRNIIDSFRAANREKLGVKRAQQVNAPYVGLQ